MKLKIDKGQVTIYFISIMATLIVLAFIVINVGKTAKDKTYADNAADAGALAACSTMATGFNYVADSQQKRKDKPTGLRKMMDDAVGSLKDAANSLVERFKQAANQVYTKMKLWNDGLFNSFGSPPAQVGAQGQAIRLSDTVQNPNSQVEQQALDRIQKQSVQYKNDTMAALDDAKNPAAKDYQNTAVSMGYKICFQNSGIHHRLGKLTSKMYSQFQQSLEMAQSGMPMTFFWVDGSARPHMVTCIIQAEPASSCNENVAQDDQPASDVKSTSEQSQLHSFSGASSSALAGWTLALNPCFYIVGELAGMGANGIAKVFRHGAESQNASKAQGEQSTYQKTDVGGASDSQNMIKNISDINNSRTISATNFQFHMGSPIKSIDGDIDIMTFYPPVQSTAIATFNYTGTGRISDGSTDGGGQSSTFECGLIGSF